MTISFPYICSQWGKIAKAPYSEPKNVKKVFTLKPFIGIESGDRVLITFLFPLQTECGFLGHNSLFDPGVKFLHIFHSVTCGEVILHAQA